MGRKHVNNPVNGSCGAAGMQCSKHQVTSFSSSNCSGNSLQIPHLSYQDYIGILAQSGPQRVGKGMGIPTNFSLIDHCPIMLMYVFNRSEEHTSELQSRP